MLGGPLSGVIWFFEDFGCRCLHSRSDLCTGHMTVVLKNSAVIYKPLRYFLGSWLRQTSKGACLFECNWVGSWQEAGETLWAGRGTVTGVGHFSTHSGYAKAQGRCCSASPASRVLLNTQQLVLMRRDWGSPFSCPRPAQKQNCCCFLPLDVLSAFRSDFLSCPSAIVIYFLVPWQRMNCSHRLVICQARCIVLIVFSSGFFARERIYMAQEIQKALRM